MMMHEDEDPWPAGHGVVSRISAALDLPLLSRDDTTWKEFQGSDSIAESALTGRWKNDNTRALLWRLLLGVIPRASPPTRWARDMSNKREEYQSLKADHRVDIAKVLDTTDPMSANPLFSGSGGGDDPWSHFYERKEMTDTIKADLERLFPTGCGDHFLVPARQELLLSVLSLWADLHPATGYRQGMHEVLAPLILSLEKEIAAATRAAAGPPPSGTAASSDASAGESSPWVGSSMVNGNPMEVSTHPGASATLGNGSSSEDLEADAFWLFTAVMDGLERFYEHRTVNSGGRRSSGGGGGGDGLDSPVVEMCKRLQGSRMREADPELQKHLADLDISPQLYGMKWARLLFGREFRVESVMQLWDHIFACSWIEGRPDVPECIEGVAVAMVMSIRDELMAEDCTGCLQLLMRFPPDQSVFAVINLSLALGQQPGGNDPARSASTAAARPQHGESSALSCDSAAEHSAPTRPDSAPAWLIDGARAGKGAENGPSRRVPAAGAGYTLERRRAGGDYGGAGVSLGTAGGGFGGEGGMEAGADMKNNWQHGLDEFTRRAVSAAQGVAKLAVQTVERSQSGASMREGQEGVSASEAASLARRLRTTCAAMEAGGISLNLAAQEIKQVARTLEGHQGGHSDRGPDTRVARTASNQGSGGGGGGVTRVFSTYSEDDGCADGLYTSDL